MHVHCTLDFLPIISSSCILPNLMIEPFYDIIFQENCPPRYKSLAGVSSLSFWELHPFIKNCFASLKLFEIFNVSVECIQMWKSCNISYNNYTERSDLCGQLYYIFSQIKWCESRNKESLFEYHEVIVLAGAWFICMQSGYVWIVGKTKNNSCRSHCC